MSLPEIGKPFRAVGYETCKRQVAVSNLGLYHNAVSLGLDPDEVGSVTRRFSVKRCWEVISKTTGSHPPPRTLRRTQEPVEHAIATEPARLGRRVKLKNPSTPLRVRS